MKASSRTSASPAFTMIELLAVIAISAILIVMLFVGLRSAGEASDQAGCVANLRTIAHASAAYSAENNGRFHPARIGDLNAYMGVVPVNGTTPANKVWFCPADPRVKQGHWSTLPFSYNRFSYAYNGSVIGLPTEPNTRFGGIAWDNALRLPSEMSRPSQVIHFITASSYYCRPQNKNGAFYHRGGTTANILYFDGSVRSFDAGPPDSEQRQQKLKELYNSGNWR